MCDELSVEFHADPSNISREWWESLSRPSPYLGYDWLRARSATIHGEPSFLAVSGKDGEALLGAPGYVTDSSSHPGYRPAEFLLDEVEDEDVADRSGARARLAGIRQRLTALDSGKSLVFGAPGRMGGVGYAARLSQAARAEVLDVAAAEAEKRAAAVSAGMICWVYALEGVDEALDQALRARGYARVSVGADCHLPIQWGSFDEYLHSFSAKRRSSIVRERRAFAEAGVTVERHGPGVLGPELAALELQWRQKYGRQADLDETVADYRKLQEHVGDALSVFVARQRGRTLGFMTFIVDGPVWWARFPGFDYSMAAEVYLYFNLLFYHPIELAIGEGVSSISYSMGSYETKCSRGCRPRHFLAYVRSPGDPSLAAELELVDQVRRHRFDRIEQKYARHGKG
ncbi:GNAT family N-acetyltransferase [Streptomyces fumanus]|uniref:GNAT family N-acetyltransferase n=1 Tax=Streptomyces fumanus TaxID=67302 RepID=UPI00167D60D4|nr:GNAT family N-acetyltransferase [Streptomyces fumanus]